MEAKHLNWKYLDIMVDMFGYNDGTKYRKNRVFFKSLWKILCDDPTEPASIDNVFDADGAKQYTKTSMVMMKSGIKRAGKQWLEGIDGDIFGERFQREYIRRWDIEDEQV